MTDEQCFVDKTRVHRVHDLLARIFNLMFDIPTFQRP